MKKINKVLVIATSIVSIMMCCDDGRADLMSKSSGQLLKKNITGSNPNFAHDSIHRQVDAVAADYNRQMNALYNQYNKQFNEAYKHSGMGDSLDRKIRKARDNLDLKKHEFQKRLEVRGNMHKRSMVAISLKQRQQKAIQEGFEKVDSFKKSLSQDIENHKVLAGKIFGTATSHISFVR